MTPIRVVFTGLELDPALLRDRRALGVIPSEWQRHRFPMPRGPANYALSKLDSWLRKNIEGRWARYIEMAAADRGEVVVAFEHDYDAVTFVMADGKHAALKED